MSLQGIMTVKLSPFFNREVVVLKINGRLLKIMYCFLRQ